MTDQTNAPSYTITAPATVEDALEMRKSIRAAIKDQPAMFALFGFRRPQRKKASKVTKGMRAPTDEDKIQAGAMLGDDLPLHEIQEFFFSKGIAMTFNRLSQMNGARP